jgi:hypothetical protein
MGQNPNSLTELPFAHSLSILSLQLPTDCNFLVATDPLLSLPGCIQWLGYVPASQFNNLSVHSELCACTSHSFTVQFSYHQAVSESWQCVGYGKL